VPWAAPFRREPARRSGSSTMSSRPTRRSTRATRVARSLNHLGRVRRHSTPRWRGVGLGLAVPVTHHRADPRCAGSRRRVRRAHLGAPVSPSASAALGRRAQPRQGARVSRSSRQPRRIRGFVRRRSSSRGRRGKADVESPRDLQRLIGRRSDRALPVIRVLRGRSSYVVTAIPDELRAGNTLR